MALALLRGAVEVIRPAYLLAGALVAVGSVGARVVSEFLRGNVVALDFPGSDTAYALVSAVGTHMVGSIFGLGRLTRPISLGMVATAALSAKREFTG